MVHSGNVPRQRPAVAASGRRPRCLGSQVQLPHGRRASSAEPSLQMPTGAGKCWIVGSGPGLKDYLTLKAVELLKQADVVVYDDLATQDIQEFCQDSADLIYVGKRGGKASTPQLEISQLLVEQCQQGLHVVRLKGGCPSTFSRVWDEIQALDRAGAQWEMIPGVSSALAGPVLAGMPLTDTHLSKSYAVVSGHDLSQYDWAALKAVDTLVVMMGSRSLPQLIDVLREGGWPPDAKIAIIHSASRDGQDELYGDLQDIVGKTNGRDLSPSIIVVGGAVALTHPGHQSFRPQLQQMMPN